MLAAFDRALGDPENYDARAGEPGTNLIFRVGEDERHNGYAANRYIYNALAFPWKGSAA